MQHSRILKWTKSQRRLVFTGILFVVLTVLVPLLAMPAEAQAAKSQYASSDGSRQRGTQQVQAASEQVNGAQSATGATVALEGEPANITESTDDPDEIVDRIVVPTAGCEVDADATVVVGDDDGTRVRLTNNQNVTIAATEDQVEIVGTDTGGNLTDLNQIGGDSQFGTLSDTVRGEVVRVSGIVCSRDSSNGGGGEGPGDEGGSEQSGGSCPGAEEVKSVEPTTTDTEGQFEIAGETFRVTYDVNISQPNQFPTIIIDIEDRLGLGPFVQISETGSDRFISTEGPGSFDFTVQVDPPNTAEYEIIIEDCAGVAADEDDEEEIVNVPNDPLPDTGGMPVSAVVSLAALLLVGASLVGVAALRWRR